MVFMDIYSDSESVYSLDSLEGETHVKGKTRINTKNKKKSLAECKNVTIPFYKGEMLVEDLKSNAGNQSQTAFVHPNSSNNPKSKQPNNFREKLNGETINRANSYIWNDMPSKQQTSNQRISRRKELIIQNKNSLRARHRSVSYVEQFRKKYYGNNNLDSSSYSTAGSKLSERDKSMYFISCLSGESSRMSVSEFEFYDELMVSPRNELLTWNKEILQSSTLLTEKTVKSAKSNKSTKQNKVKPIVLSRIEVTIPDQTNLKLDKKRSIEKREVYANNVKLRNQMKINRQKERDKNDRFNGSHACSGLSFEECLLKPQANNVSFPLTDRKTSGFHPPSVANQEKSSKKNEKKEPGNEFVQKTKRGGRQQSQNKKTKKTSELSSLQDRHEREKSLIESLKNLILKTEKT